MNWKLILNRLKNTGTIISIVSLIMLILTTNGLEIDSEKVMVTVKSICSIGVVLGILNNTDTKGLDMPFKKDGE